MPNTRRASEDLPDTFLPRRVADAADAAMEDVLKEDRLLRKFGVIPPNGRSR